MKKILFLLCVSIGIASACRQNSEGSETNSATDSTSLHQDPLPSWNEGIAKQAIISFVHATTDKADSGFVSPEERIATFDQDGTIWVEHPVYTQIMYCIARIPDIAATKPELKNKEPFKTILSGNYEAIMHLGQADFDKIAAVVLTGMSEDQFRAEVKNWILNARDPRWKKPYSNLAYQPMLEVMHYLRTNGFKTYIVTGSGQDFVRAYSEQTYGIPPEQVIGSAVETSFKYDSVNRQSALLKQSKLLLNDNGPGKPEGIQFVIGRRPYISFGNTVGDQQMLEYTKTGKGQRLAMLVLHDDSTREYAYGPATGLPDSKIGTFSQALYDEAQKSGWIVISMKKDWNTIFSK